MMAVTRLCANTISRTYKLVTNVEQHLDLHFGQIKKNNKVVDKVANFLDIIVLETWLRIWYYFFLIWMYFVW